MFVKTHVRQGLLPLMLERLVFARSDVKAAMKREKNEAMLRVLDSKQGAIKVSANSIYGLCGARTNSEGCIAIASATTSYGRDVIIKVADYIEERSYLTRPCAT
jgi:DNA polymerase delta subunit 1